MVFECFWKTFQLFVGYNQDKTELNFTPVYNKTETADMLTAQQICYVY